MTTGISSPFSHELDCLASRCLRRAGISRPPIDAFVLARRLKIDVLLDSGQSHRGRHALVGGRPAIFVRPDDRRERQQWAVAHELGETLAHEVDNADLPSEAAGQMREQTANLLASRLLLPADWFFPDALRLDQNLLRLKSRYATASHELIAWRLLDLEMPSTITVFDQGRPIRRRSNATLRPAALSRFELDGWQEAHRFGREIDRTTDGLRLQVWPIHEPDWRREIVRLVHNEIEWQEECQREDE